MFGKIDKVVEELGLMEDAPVGAILLKNQAVISVGDGFAIASDENDIKEIMTMGSMIGKPIKPSDVYENKMFDRKVIIMRNTIDIMECSLRNVTATWKDGGIPSSEYSDHVLEPSVNIV